jgi:hypothetical protein
MPVPKLVDVPVKVRSNIEYMSTKKHRIKRGNSNASLWLIDMKSEYICFLKTKPHKNSRETIGAYIKNNKLNPLGEKGGYDKLIFAKFENHENSGTLWHGYPIDYRENTDYRPSSEYLKYLVNRKSISNAKKKKIQKGLEL